MIRLGTMCINPVKYFMDKVIILCKTWVMAIEPLEMQDKFCRQQFAFPLRDDSSQLRTTSKEAEGPSILSKQKMQLFVIRVWIIYT